MYQSLDAKLLPEKCGGYYIYFLRSTVFPSFSTFSKHRLPSEYHFHIWQVSPHLSSCGHTRQIWKRFQNQNKKCCKGKSMNGVLVAPTPTMRCLSQRRVWWMNGCVSILNVQWTAQNTCNAWIKCAWFHGYWRANVITATNPAPPAIPPWRRLKCVPQNVLHRLTLGWVISPHNTWVSILNYFQILIHQNCNFESVCFVGNYRQNWIYEQNRFIEGPYDMPFVMMTSSNGNIFRVTGRLWG